MNDQSTWNDLILRAHFESLNPANRENESYVVLLSEIARRLEQPEPISAEERQHFLHRIQKLVRDQAGARPRPMRKAGRVVEKNENRKTGT